MSAVSKSVFGLAASLLFCTEASAEPPAASSPDSELTSVLDSATRVFCQDPKAAACQLVDRFKKAGKPSLPKQSRFSIGPRFTDDPKKPQTSDGYLTVSVRPQGQGTEALWLTVTSDNDQEERDTVVYIDSIRSGHRKKDVEFHSFLEKTLSSRPFMAVKEQAGSFVFQAPGYANGAWLRQGKDEWLVIVFQVDPRGMRPRPRLWIASLPIESK